MLSLLQLWKLRHWRLNYALLRFFVLLGLLIPGVLQAQMVTVEQGQLAGAKTNGVFSFKGIPFAAPPIGELRWAAPQQPADWDGVRHASDYGNDCIQLPFPKGSPYYTALNGPSEDCLYLNVWSSNLGVDRKAPVMVWIHGGGHTRGSGAVPSYDGSEFARKGVILVTVNYRLNVFGWMPHPELSAEQGGHSGNYGLMDHVAALQWVRANISQFGGNPDNVTIFGESAGSSSVSQLMVNPAAGGLFHKAIGQSGGIFRPLTELADAHARGEKIAGAAGVDSLAQMRALPAETLLSTFSELEKSGLRLGAIIDGRSIPGQAIDLYRSGQYNPVPLIAGYNRDESTVFALTPGGNVATNRQQLSAQLDRFAPAGKDAFLAAYAETDKGDPRQPYLDFWRDMVFGWNMQTWARLNEEQGQPAWLYYFTRQPPTPAGKALGAFHAAEIAYVFGNGVPETQADRGLSEAMQQFWINFAVFGHPNGKVAQFWPRFGEKQNYIVLDEHPRVGRRLDADRMKVWDEALGM